MRVRMPKRRDPPHRPHRFGPRPTAVLEDCRTELAVIRDRRESLTR